MDPQFLVCLLPALWPCLQFTHSIHRRLHRWPSGGCLWPLWLSRFSPSHRHTTTEANAPDIYHAVPCASEGATSQRTRRADLVIDASAKEAAHEASC